MPSRCQFGECKKKPSYGFFYEFPRLRYCTEHRIEGMVNAKSTKCESCDCKKPPVYGPAEPTLQCPQYCVQHRLPGMVDLKNPRCEYEGCSRRPVYAPPGINMRATRCPSHMVEGMIDIVRDHCEILGCARKPMYAEPNMMEPIKPRFCILHKESHMLDIVNKCCSFEGCLKHPCFSNLGEKRPKWCEDHRTKDMVNVVAKRCAADRCLKVPSYGIPGDRPVFCASHKVLGMKDIVNRSCEAVDCYTKPTYGLPGSRPSFCAMHKVANMVDLKSRRCKGPSCTRQPLYNFSDLRPAFCAAHKAEGMVNTKHYTGAKRRAVSSLQEDSNSRRARRQIELKSGLLTPQTIAESLGIGRGLLNLRGSDESVLLDNGISLLGDHDVSDALELSAGNVSTFSHMDLDLNASCLNSAGSTFPDTLSGSLTMSPSSSPLLNGGISTYHHSLMMPMCMVRGGYFPSQCGDLNHVPDSECIVGGDIEDVQHIRTSSHTTI